MNIKTVLAENERIPDGFVAIGPADHPRNRQSGMLIRNRATGIYMLLVAGAAVSVPHGWAAKTAANMGKGSDAIQDELIARMESLKLNPNQVAERIGDGVSRTHVCDFLTRRSSIGSHKLQHIVLALDLQGDLFFHWTPAGRGLKHSQ